MIDLKEGKFEGFSLGASLRKSRTISFCSTHLCGSFCYMAIFCIQNKLIKVKIVSSFSTLLKWKVSCALQEWNSNKTY